MLGVIMISILLNTLPAEIEPCVYDCVDCRLFWDLATMLNTNTLDAIITVMDTMADRAM